VGVLLLVNDPSVLELDVEVLIDQLEHTTDGQIVLELQCHLIPHELRKVGEELLPTQKQIKSHQISPNWLQNVGVK
jgi:flagellar biosynthesis/type III secretory pathway M-ring protein FliF/YscJ